MGSGEEACPELPPGLGHLGRLGPGRGGKGDGSQTPKSEEGGAGGSDSGLRERRARRPNLWVCCRRAWGTWSGSERRGGSETRTPKSEKGGAEARALGSHPSVFRWMVGPSPRKAPSPASLSVFQSLASWLSGPMTQQIGERRGGPSDSGMGNAPCLQGIETPPGSRPEPSQTPGTPGYPPPPVFPPPPSY